MRGLSKRTHARSTPLRAAEATARRPQDRLSGELFHVRNLSPLHSKSMGLFPKICKQLPNSANNSLL